MSAFPEGDPGASGLHADWYAANAAAGTVTAQRCGCGQWRHPARYRCPACHGDEWSFEPVSAGATIESWTITRRPLHFAFGDVVPYAIVVARTPDGPQFLVHVRPSVSDPSDVAIGTAVRLAVDRFGVPYAVREPAEP